MARIVRGQVFQIKERNMYLQLRALGANSSRIILKHLIPNTVWGHNSYYLHFHIPSCIFTKHS